MDISRFGKALAIIVQAEAAEADRDGQSTGGTDFKWALILGLSSL
jgi:hypothetical protein